MNISMILKHAEISIFCCSLLDPELLVFVNFNFFSKDQKLLSFFIKNSKVFLNFFFALHISIKLSLLRYVIRTCYLLFKLGIYFIVKF